MTDPLAGLIDGSLPAAEWPEAIAALALGLLLAAAASLCLRLFARRPPSAKECLLADLRDLRNLTSHERLAGQAVIAKRLKTGAISGLEQAIYERSPTLSPDDVEAQLIVLIKKAKI